MNENVNIIQVRISVFVSENIGYEPGIAGKYNALLMPSGQICQAFPSPNGQMLLNPNPSIPWGTTWGLQDEATRIVFLPGKIDFIKDILAKNDNSSLQEFTDLCLTWIERISENIRECGRELLFTRLALAPLYGLSESDNGFKVWDRVFNPHLYEVDALADRNVTYLYKRILELNDRKINVNLLHNIFDGKRFDPEKTEDATLISFDINTVPHPSLYYTAEEIRDFYMYALSASDELLNNLV